MVAKVLAEAAKKAATLYSVLKHGAIKLDETICVAVRDDKETFYAAMCAKLLGYEAKRSLFALPDIRAEFGADLRSYQEELINLSEVLGDFYASGKEKRIIIAPINTISKFLPAPKLFDKTTLNFGEEININELKEKLLNWGYNLVDVAEQKGEISFRGEVIDIFANSNEKPIRILLDENQIESIRYFDAATQKSEREELEKIDIKPALFALDKLDAKTSEKLNDLIANDNSQAFVKDFAGIGFWKLRDLNAAIAVNEIAEIYFLDDLQDELNYIYEDGENLPPKDIFINAPILTKIETKLPNDAIYKAIAVENPKTLIEFHKNKNIAIALEYETQLKVYDIDAKKYKLFFTDAAISLIAPNDLVVSLNKPEKQKRRRANFLLDDLKKGDLVVHENYGVGRFAGLEQVRLLGGARDFAAIIYQNDDKLLLPVENLYLIDRYIAESGSPPTLDRLGKGGFARIKEGAKARLYEIAGEIVRRAAEREVADAPAIYIEREKIENFQNNAGFDYTADQARAVEEILSDLESGKVMDRLLSGDVGFGKTEVAMNAIFAAHNAGFQAAMIAPTTLLSHQHHETLKDRFAPFNIKIARLDRFTNAAEKRAIVSGLKSGEISVVVGTHALLSAEFKNLALMIVDEEHKFGVKQKERLKDKSASLHLLSMSATPIPRSLNMALSQIKQMSEILTPPAEREDVRTIVRNYDPKAVKEAILREVNRGGQVFYIFNRIAGIEAKKKAILDILPPLRILVLHSQVDGNTSENEILRFARGEYDLLLSTTIVESGIHIPNANTIIIDGADRFGIADLHQLRGRVGRSRRRGYCFFLVGDEESLTEEAKKRLLALENNSYLGGGSALAFHDLEIRGGGNILGADQSGHIKQIGYSLYLKMLEDALAELSGKAGERQARAKPPVEIRLAIKAFISEELVIEERLRLELYRRFSLAKTTAEVYEIASEIRDRFGELDIYTRQFADLMAIKVLACERGVVSAQNFGQNITLAFADGRKISLAAPSKDDDDIIARVTEGLKKL
ncbi:MAG: transcription-repair coupling factor [Helicobacteraceae bacterium]|jgi:transcription-repair coupling factor (superfamily II helicase)|nr:transcription-repair coupling factor [Helicobacteraceae bacterium]